ncbi:hypothetical protein CMV63_04540 [Escherichia coli]|nr:hypothetical protein CMV63_04540 [Escherichia coli]
MQLPLYYKIIAYPYDLHFQYMDNSLNIAINTFTENHLTSKNKVIDLYRTQTKIYIYILRLFFIVSIIMRIFIHKLA